MEREGVARDHLMVADVICLGDTEKQTKYMCSFYLYKNSHSEAKSTTIGSPVRASPENTSLSVSFDDLRSSKYTSCIR